MQKFAASKLAAAAVSGNKSTAGKAGSKKAKPSYKQSSWLMSMGCPPADALAEVPYGDIYKNINAWKKKEKDFKDSHDGNQCIDGAMLELLQNHGDEPVDAGMTYSEGMALWKGMTGDDGLRFKQAKQMIYQFNLDPTEVLNSTYDFATNFIAEAEADLATGAITISTVPAPTTPAATGTTQVNEQA